MNEWQAGVLIGAAVYSAIELTWINWHLRKIKESLEERDHEAVQ